MMHWANDYVGIPWLDGGRTRAGCDCYGLVRLVLAERFSIFVSAYDQFYVSTTEERQRIADTIQADKGPVGWKKLSEKADAIPGDVALFKIWGLPIHCGILFAPLEMLHVRRGCDAVPESMTNPLWNKRLEGVYRYGG